MITFREAYDSDIDRLVAMTEDFLQLTPYGRLFPPPAGYVEVLVRLTLQKGKGFVAVDESGRIVGMIAGWMARHGLTSQPYVEEVVWYVEERARPSGCGVQLLGLLEHWASISGATMIKMLAPAESPVGKLLERQRYSRVETAFIKPLQRATARAEADEAK